jgi:phthalate 4,5-cis-dihydrodiol dehydrogenase
MKLGCGLLGCGRMGRGLAEVIRARVADAHVAAAYDAYAPNLESFCQDFAAAPAVSADDLLGRDDVAAVIVASPNDLHCEHTLAAAGTGKHVFCEKPMALSLADCDRMIEACDRAGVKLMVGHSLRLTRPVRRLRELAQSGALGEPRFGLATYFFAGFRQRDSGLWHVDVARSGGLFFHMAIHDLDLLLDLFGPAGRVHYAGGHYNDEVRGFDDVASLLIEFQSGATGVVSAASISAVHRCEKQFIFSAAYARLESPWSYLEYGPDVERMTRVDAEEVPGPDAFEMELGSFVRWVLHDELPVLTAEEGRAAVALAEAAERAKKTRAPVELASG